MYMEPIDFNRIMTKYFYVSLGIITLVYFAVVRVFQDWLYHMMGIDQRPADMFLSFGPKFSQAEPFEGLLYLLGYVVVIVGAYLLTPVIERLLQMIRLTKKHLMVGGVCVLGMMIGAFVLKFPFDRFYQYVQSNTLGHVLWFIATKRIIVTYVLLAMSAVFFVGYYWYLNQNSKFEIRNSKNENQEHIFKKLWPFCLLALAFLIFNPNFPIDAHHYNYFVGSVHEVYQGKALLYESSNLYGLFNIYFLMALFKIIPLTFTAFCAVIMAVYFIYFSSLWVIIRKWLGSYTIATLTMVPIVAITYFFQTSPTRSALFLPAMSPFRWGFYVVVLWLMSRFENTHRMRFLRWSLFVSAVSLFWNFDSGLFLSAATLGTIGYVTWNMEHGTWNINKMIQKQGKVLLEYAGYVIGLFAVTSIVNRLVYGSWPQWELFFRESKYFSTGIAMYPLPKFGVFEILFFVYAVVVVGVFARLLKRDDVKSFNLPLVFLTLFGMFSFIYYIGESSWQILYVVVAPFVLVCAYGFQQVRLGITPIEFRTVVRTGFATIIFFGVALLAFKLPVEFAIRNYHGIATRFTSIDPLDQETHDDAEYLKVHYEQHRIPVISRNDTKLMMYSGKVNWFDFYYIFTIYFKQEMQKYVDVTLRERPTYVIVGKGQYRNDQVEYFLDGIQGDYQLKESLKTVEVYEKVNK